jgi:hypothetical protein
MGKRELLLILVFVVLGAVVYQVTAPPAAPGQSGFSFGRVVENIRREVAGNRANAEITATASHPVPEGIRELRVTLQNTPVTIIGESRTDIASELWVRSTGYDEAEARRLAGEAALTVEPAGPTITVSLKYPRGGSQRGRLQLRVPADMLVLFGPTNVRLDVTGARGVELESARGDVTIKQIAGAVTVTHRGGDLTIEDAGAVRLNTRGSDVRLTRVTGEAHLVLQAGELRGAELTGPTDIEATSADVLLEKFQQPAGPLRIHAVTGSVIVRGLRGEGRIEGRNAEIDVAIDHPAPLAIFNSNEPVQVTLPTSGFTLDAVATEGRITVPDTVASQIAATASPDGKEQKASGDVHGGGPTITIRATSGDIRLRAPESD